MDDIRKAFTPLINALNKIGKKDSLQSDEKKQLEQMLLQLSKDKESWLPDWAWETPREETVRTLYTAPNNGPIIHLITWQKNYQGCIHNHNTWGMVTCLHGRESSLAWTYDLCPIKKTNIVNLKSETECTPGGILHIDYDDIHSVNNHTDPSENNGTAISLHIYGANLEHTQRLKFDQNDHTSFANENTEFKNAELRLLNEDSLCQR